MLTSFRGKLMPLRCCCVAAGKPPGDSSRRNLTTMGSTFSKTPGEEASGPPPQQRQDEAMATVVAQTPAPKKRGPGRPRKAPGTAVSRASRRTAKSGPARVVIKSVAKKKTPKRKFPLTPETRAKGRSSVCVCVPSSLRRGGFFLFPGPISQTKKRSAARRQWRKRPCRY